MQSEDDASGLTLRCPNCGAVLVGPWCHACGQAGHPHRSLGAIGHDLLHGVLHFEGRVWHTLPMLVARPGELTRRFIHGERQYFVSPFALFLFAVFLSFAVLGLTSRPASALGPEVDPGASQVYATMERALAEIDGKIAAARASGAATATLERDRAELLNGARRLGYTTPDGTALVRPQSNAEAVAHADLGSEPLNAALRKVAANPALTFYKVQSYAYKFAWALIPLSLPFLWLLYAFDRRYGPYDHYVFITSSLALALLLFVLVRLLMVAGLAGEGLAVAAVLLLPVHMYRQLRGAYRGGRAATLVRTVLLVAFAGTVTLLFAAMLLTAGLLA